VADSAVQHVFSKVNRRTPTLSAQFKNSLAILMDRMTKCYPHFVRCIKPNLNQRAENFMPEFVKTQLLYTGVLEVTRIRQEGYAWRPAFDEFVRRYKIVAFDVLKLDDVAETEKNAIKIIKRSGLDNWLVGKTKLFLKFYHFDVMEKRLEKFFKDVVRAQNAVRRHWACRELHKLQARARMEKAECDCLEAMEAAERKVLEEERRIKREEERKIKAEKEALLAEQKKKEREAAKENVKKVSEERAQLAAARIEAEESARAAAEEARRLAEGHEAGEALRLAEEAEIEAQRLRLEREAALAAAEKAREAAAARRLEMQKLAEAAEEARRAQAAAEEEARQIARECKQSRKLRKNEFNEAARRAAQRAEEESVAAEEARKQKEEADRLAKMTEEVRSDEERRIADEKQAVLRERLRHMEEEAAKAKQLADQQAKAAAEAAKAREEAEKLAHQRELERLAEEARHAEERAQELRERQEKDVTRPDFRLDQHLEKNVANGIKCKDVVVEPRKCMGFLTKMKARDLQSWMGSLLRRGTSDWIHRYFVLDLDDMTLNYYETEKMKKLKSSIPPQSIIRVYFPTPAVSAQFKMDHLFMVETKDRTFFCQAPSGQAAELWLSALSAVATSNHLRQTSQTSLNVSATGSTSSVAMRPHSQTMANGSRLSMYVQPTRGSNA
jgi:myosin-3